MEYELLRRINNPNDIKKISPKDYGRLAFEIRHFLVRKVSRTGGHLASNLGVVELTMALHLCCDLPKDKIVWDVGHQCYVHKLLTGRKDGFDRLRQFHGMSGFPKRQESACDAFDTGHGSTSLSAALGLVSARDLKQENHKVYAVIGDGALSGGMAFEALNNAARLKSNLVIILNDNQMSIAKNVGGMSGYLGKIRTNKNYTDLKDAVENALNKVPGCGGLLTDKIRSAKDLIKRIFISGMLFEDMGITYIGPIDGHDIKQMRAAFENAAKLQKAVIVHVCTQKGKGYAPAQKNPSAFHGVAPFSVKDGKARTKDREGKLTYTEVFGHTLLECAKRDFKITAVCAAMPEGTGLTDFAKLYPDRFFDVGIAEEHAVTFAAGMAAGGLHPVVAIYSTFLQRAYDQILHDVCLDSLPVTFAIDRAGIVGNDGETHQGLFDLAFLRQMPNMTVMAPKNAWELRQMLLFAVNLNAPAAIRYPRGLSDESMENYCAPVQMGKAEWMKKGEKVALLAIGSMGKIALKAAEILAKEGLNVSVVNMRFVKPLDTELLRTASLTHSVFVTLEEGVASGGFGEAVASWCKDKTSVTVCNIALPDQFVEHGQADELKKEYRLDAKSVADTVRKLKF